VVFQDVAVSIQSRSNRDLPSTSGTISEVSFSQIERSKNALKLFGIGIGATFISVFIPILHFILVPSFLMATFYLSLARLREEKRNAGGSGECPKCHKNFEIQKSKWDSRFVDVCGSCHDDLEIQLGSSSSH
jgi:hypothetical protein